jgi:peptidylprolyl isomerase
MAARHPSENHLTSTFFHRLKKHFLPFLNRIYFHIYIKKEESMAQAKAGDTVKIEYTGKLDDGTVFDSSSERKPLEFTIGDGKTIPEFEKAVIGMKPGESKTFEIACENAYGPYRQEMVMVINKNRLPEGLIPKVDQKLEVQPAEGDPFVVKVIEVTEENVTLDGNHPLAGKDLTFDIELTQIS